ncbi:MAG TPA: 23S rRNA (pseudouridine(1915)-N(3))-methyltransferase RlmH, partial [Candidatus Saccharibacteria bacterium]|nr:23S rRNA (pseudouridine(1915)-N(3))-methyltransferase RlmH [Candidatus Saccharibacteria bacterium]
SSLAAQAARKQESQKLLQIVKPSDMVWLLDERGEQISSPALAAKLNVMQLHAVRNIAIIIGGAYGVDDTVRSRASWVWSLSSLVFPHQLVRLLLVEQLYRATQINKGTGYHHA